jgi:hypothetical protein
MRMRKLRRLVQPGDHVVVQRQVLGVDAFTHHGIYAGDGTVIHFADDKIRNISLRKFGDGDDVWINIIARAVRLILIRWLLVLRSYSGERLISSSSSAIGLRDLCRRDHGISGGLLMRADSLIAVPA